MSNSASDHDRWQFNIDVGGTFTDTIARTPEGRILRHKTLSSGITKGRLSAASTRQRLFDPVRCADPPDFWQAFGIRLVANTGEPLSESIVSRFHRESGEFVLDASLDFDPQPGQSYELWSDEESPNLAIRYLLELAPGQNAPPLNVRLGTTRGTNALLTRTGAKTVFVTTRGFGDVLRIGYQDRPHLFDLNIKKNEMLYALTMEVDERISQAGDVLVALDQAAIRREFESAWAQGIRSVAICLLHGYRFTEHERAIARIASDVGFSDISVSHEVAPLIKIVSRGDTTLVDAYLNPVLRSYASRIAEKTQSTQLDLRCMTSSGGLVSLDAFSGKDSILSGPAGGVVGYSKVATSCGFAKSIGFDMGGTSTDVSRFDGQFEHEYETEKAGVRIVTPMLSINTVAAGGGSICKFNGVMLTVGPDSAGADPGPACYGRGGPLTVTDVNLFLGKLSNRHFPFALNQRAVEMRLEEIARQIERSTKEKPLLFELAEGFLQIANAHMEQAIRSISISKGYDVREYALLPFGGAAGQHACAIADQLGMNTILIHPDAGILSAVGISRSEMRRHRVRGVYQLLDEASVRLKDWFDQLTSDAIDELKSDLNQTRCDIQVNCTIQIRYHGTDVSLPIEYGGFRTVSDSTDTNEPAEADVQQLVDRFEHQHRQLYGYLHSGRGLEVVSIRAEAIGVSANLPVTSEQLEPQHVKAVTKTRMRFAGTTLDAGVFERDHLRPGNRVDGPAQINEATSTTIVDPGWSASVFSQGELLIERSVQKRQVNLISGCDPVSIEIFNRHFEAIAEQMGITLRNTAISTNVKERLDFSCAIFTASGDLVVNAPHIPVHLGAMGQTVKAIIESHDSIQAGDVFVTNDPYRGGSHLPDVTVVTPVFAANQTVLQFFTASRAHHAEIGGVTPGSMPPFSKCLADEGVLIQSFKLIDAGESKFDELRMLLGSGKYPSRDIESNLADISAQVAANRFGAIQLQQLITRHGWHVVEQHMQAIQGAAEIKMRNAISGIPNGVYRFSDSLDDGAIIQVAIQIESETATIDFRGTAGTLSSNLNANRAIVTAAVMYVFRSLIQEDIPLNQGVLKPLEILIPECLLNPPAHDDAERCAAIAGGNVETSQRVVDVLLGALGAAAASQGTMNNLLFGNEQFGYYETICGGAGATATADGADAVHSHMTNTRITDPEILEQRYPVRLNRFAIRPNSGGAGAYRGGDGIEREIEFLAPLTVSLLTQRRHANPPYGMKGGQPGACGENIVLRSTGEVEHLPSSAVVEMFQHDRLLIKTPGGGGFGNADPR